MRVLNQVLGSSPDPEPPMRDVEGFVVQVRVRRVPKMHLLTAYGTNQCDTDETRLPAPEQPLLTQLDEIALAELIERYIEYFDGATGKPVHLATPFVKHYLRRDDDALPVATGVAALPMGSTRWNPALGTGTGSRPRYRLSCSARIRVNSSSTSRVHSGSCGRTMRYLTDEWLCDIAADYIGRCIIIASALTIVERLLLCERPAFFITAGQRGGVRPQRST